MSQRLSARFAAVKAENRPALITYLMAGDPSPQVTSELLHTMAEAGADIIELGFPFSDPMADGPVIQAAAIRSLAQKTTLKSTLEIVSSFRKTDTDTPIILMGYYNPVLAFGPEKLIEVSAKAGVDGLLIVDLPPEEDDTLFAAAEKADIALIKLATPTTDSARADVVLSKATGFLYYVALTGITGAKSAAIQDVEKAVKTLKQKTTLPVAVGFGIKTPEDAKAHAAFADAVVVGSSLVRLIEEHTASPEALKPAISKAVSALAKALR